MTTYSFHVQLDPEQSEAFVQALLPNKGDIFAYWDSLAQPRRYGHIPYDADDLFCQLEQWSLGESLDFSVRDILGLSIHRWAENTLEKMLKDIGYAAKYLPTDDRLKLLFGETPDAARLNKVLADALGKLNPKEKMELRGLKLIFDNMGVGGRWMGMSSTNSFHIQSASRQSHRNSASNK